MKVFELAKILGKTSKEILQAADHLEILIKTHLSSLSEEEVKQLLSLFISNSLITATKYSKFCKRNGRFE